MYTLTHRTNTVETTKQTSIWRIECDYDWVDSKSVDMISLNEYSSKAVVRTLSGNIIPQPDLEPAENTGLSRKVDYSVDFSIVHQV